MGKSLFVFRRTAASCRVLEVEVETVELSLTQELYARLNELGPTGNVVQHRRHLGDSEVPATDSQQRLDARLTLLDVIESSVPIADQSQQSCTEPSNQRNLAYLSDQSASLRPADVDIQYSPSLFLFPPCPSLVPRFDLSITFFVIQLRCLRVRIQPSH